MFSLAVLSVMVTICMKMMAAITAAFAVKYLISMPELGFTSAQTTDGINSMALQQGGLGILLTTMILSAPPMAAAFFQGTLGQFNSYSPFGHVKPEPKGGGGSGVPGTYSYQPPAPQQSQGQSAGPNQANAGTPNFNNYSAGGQGLAASQDQLKQKDPTANGFS